jgi:hypothetical protein
MGPRSTAAQLNRELINEAENLTVNLESVMRVKLLVLGLVLLPSTALADSQMPWFGGEASGTFHVREVVKTASKATSYDPLKVNVIYHCSTKFCSNQSNFATGSIRAYVPPQ